MPRAVAPARGASGTAIEPTPPAAPAIATVSPGARLTARMAPYAVAPATNSEPATSHGTAAGLGVNWVAGTATYSAWLDRRLENPMTSSPTAKPLTPEPNSATTPARSLPCPDGNVAGNMSRTAPARIAASLILIP